MFCMYLQSYIVLNNIYREKMFYADINYTSKQQNHIVLFVINNE